MRSKSCAGAFASFILNLILLCIAVVLLLAGIDYLVYVKKVTVPIEVIETLNGIESPRKDTTSLDVLRLGPIYPDTASYGK